MITSFKHKGLQKLFANADHRGIPAYMELRIARALDRLDAAILAQDMDLPGYKFHSLKGAMKGRYAVTITGNWRLTFGFEGENAVDVDLEDYH